MAIADRATSCLAYSPTVGTAFGSVPVHLHWSCLALLPLMGMMLYPELGMTWRLYTLALLLTATLVASVVLHELAHVYMFLRRDIGVEAVMIHVLGGATLCSEEKMQRQNQAAPLSAIATYAIGPVANLAIAAPLLGVLLLAQHHVEVAPEHWSVVGWDAVRVTAMFNIALGVYNLLPIFPLDGGRMLFYFFVWLSLSDVAAQALVCVSTLLLSAAVIAHQLWLGLSSWALAVSLGLTLVFVVVSGMELWHLWTARGQLEDASEAERTDSAVSPKPTARLVMPQQSEMAVLERV